MNAISVTKAREMIYKLIASVNADCKPITITNNKGENAVLLSEKDWNAIQETLYLMSIPEISESIIDGAKTSIDDCIPEEQVEW